MKDRLENVISDVEEKWSDIIYNEVNSILSSVFLPSHNFNHHKRVWYFAKDLLLKFDKKNNPFSFEFTEALFIAVFFHDTGLSKTLNPEHGLESSRLAEKFLVNQKKNWQNSYTKELIEAIIRHDDKNYASEHLQQHAPGIYHILTIADDLDALGCLGLIRYFEIYFRRTISDTEIIKLIESNISSRFCFIQKHIKEYPDYLNFHKLRFDKALSYLSKMKTNDIVELKTIFDNKIDPLSIDLNLLKSELLKELISEAGKGKELRIMN